MKTTTPEEITAKLFPVVDANNGNMEMMAMTELQDVAQYTAKVLHLELKERLLGSSTCELGKGWMEGGRERRCAFRPVGGSEGRSEGARE